jgi:hypothetical protein
VAEENYGLPSVDDPWASGASGGGGGRIYRRACRSGGYVMGEAPDLRSSRSGPRDAAVRVVEYHQRPVPDSGDGLEPWLPPADWTTRIVAAACIIDGTVFVGARHFDPVMRAQIKRAGLSPLTHEQGFIDQWGRYYTREEAMDVVLVSGQPFDAKRNSGNGEMLFSEGLY